MPFFRCLREVCLPATCIIITHVREMSTLFLIFFEFLKRNSEFIARSNNSHLAFAAYPLRVLARRAARAGPAHGWPPICAPPAAFDIARLPFPADRVKRTAGQTAVSSGRAGGRATVRCGIFPAQFAGRPAQRNVRVQWVSAKRREICYGVSERPPALFNSTKKRRLLRCSTLQSTK